MTEQPQQVTQQAIATASALKLPQTTAELTPVQHGWLMFAQMRQDLTPQLQNGELAIQAKVNSILASTDLPTIQALLKEVKAQFSADQEKRKSFTGYFEEKVSQPLMAFEKRNNDLIGKAVAYELSTRSAAANAAAHAQAKETEKAQLRAHITSEYFRLAALYRQHLDAIITAAYTTSLETRQLEHPDNVEQRIVAQVPPLMNFPALRLLTPEEANAIFFEVESYDRAGIVTAAIQVLHAKWQNFSQDVANAASAIENEIQQQEEKEIEVQQDIAINTGMQQVQAAAAVSSIPVGPKVKKSVEVIVVNSPDWGMAVMSHFINNWQESYPLVRVKTIDKLSIGQMAVALGQLASKTGEDFKGLELTEVVK